MEDNGNIWYYLVLGAIYVLSRVFGKKKKPPTPKSKPDTSPQRDITPPTAEKEEAPVMSFEDILRELSGQPKPQPIPVSEPVSEPIISPAYSNDEIDDIAVDYEVPDAIGKNPYQAPPTSVASTREQDKFIRADHFKIIELETVDYISSLSEEGGSAKAFVLSEIFAKKH